MRLGNAELDILEAWAAASGKDTQQLLQRLLDGDEPTERYFEGARPSAIEGA